MSAVVEIDPAEAVVRHRRAGSGKGLNVLGCRVNARTSCKADGDGSFIFECIVPPGGGPPLHTHPQWEAFYVLEGTVEFGRVNAGIAEVIVGEPGDLISIGRNAAHSFRNIGSVPARMLVICEPGMEPFFYAAGADAPDGPPSEAEIGRVIGVMQQHGQVIVGPHPGT